MNIKLQDLRHDNTLANLRAQGVRTRDLKKLKFILDFCETIGESCEINWVPTREAAWTVSPHIEIVAGGVRTALTGWGLRLSQAIDGAYDKLQSGSVLMTMNMATDRRRWQWNKLDKRFEQTA